MHFTRQLAGLLHDEHLHTMSTLENLETILYERRKKPMPDPADDLPLARMMRQIQAMARDELPAHFEFEEGELFPRLAEFGDAAMGELLAEEHRALLAISAGLAEICTEALGDGLQPARWEDFKRLAGDFIETMTGHIQKEEMGLLHALESILDEDSDRNLTAQYMAAR